MSLELARLLSLKSTPSIPAHPLKSPLLIKKVNLIFTHDLHLWFNGNNISPELLTLCNMKMNINIWNKLPCTLKSESSKQWDYLITDIHLL